MSSCIGGGRQPEMTRRRSGDESSRDELSRLLLALRGNRSQGEAGALVGLTQAKVSRAERGRFPLAPEQVEAYAAALGATADQRAYAAELATTKIAQHVRGRVSLVRVGAAIQERIEGLERTATLVRGWQPAAIHGSLQTPAYTTALLDGDGSGDPGAAWWAARIRRTAKLAEPGRTWHLLMSEAALRWPLVSRQVMVEQIDHLLALSKLPTVELGIIDLITPKAFVAPPAFHLYGREVVSVATEAGTSFIDDPPDIAHYEALLHRLDTAAVHGDDARALLGRIAGEYRDLDAAS